MSREIELIEKYMGFIDEEDFECEDELQILIEELEQELMEGLDEATDLGKGFLRQAGIAECKAIGARLGKMKRYGCLVTVYKKYIARLKKEQGKGGSEKEKKRWAEKIKKAEARLKNYRDVVSAGDRKIRATTPEAKKKAKKERRAAFKKAKKGQGIVRRTFLASKI